MKEIWLDEILNYSSSKELDEYSQKNWNLDGKLLMGLAGSGLFHAYRKEWEKFHSIDIFCGRGNNGGDGYALGYFLAMENYKVNLWEFGSPTTDTANFYRDLCFKLNSSIQSIHAFRSMNIVDGSLLVDCLLGIGAKGKLRPEFLNLESEWKILRNNFNGLKIIAVDHPTFSIALYDGLAEIGNHKWENLSFPKTKKIKIPIGFPTDIFLKEKYQNQSKNYYFSTISKEFSPGFPKEEHFHKYLAGSAIFLGGESGMEGAIQLAQSAFLGLGGGISKSFFFSPEAKSQLAFHNPSWMIETWQETSHNDSFWNKAEVVVFGPGTDPSKDYSPIYDFLKNWSSQNPKRKVIMDGGAIQSTEALGTLNENWILTPHLGEFYRLTGSDSNPKEAEALIDEGRKANNKLKCNILIKSQFQILIDANNHSYIWDSPNPKLATMGTGDLLTGILAVGFFREKNPIRSVYHSLRLIDFSRTMDLTSPTSSEILEYLKVH